MNLLFRVLYAAHARGTHHKLALDALRFLAVDRADDWRRLVLLHAQAYIAGSKAPDDEFKDFKNHVLHPRDGYWGGAMELSQTWYANLVRDLKAESWADAARAAGILTHYLADPLHPFHTAQSEAENAIHRAAEWSISRAYDDLWREATARQPALDLAAGSGPNWLREVVCAGADAANQSYEKLIAHYSITAGVVDPPSGLDTVARRLVGDLLVRAARTIATVLDRAIAEAAVAPPEVSLTLPTVLATLAIPRKLLAKRLADAADRREVESMYDELKATGRVEETLPFDDRVVRELHAAEVLAPRSAARAAARAERIAATASHTAEPAPEASVEVFLSAADEGAAPALSRLAPRPAAANAGVPTTAVPTMGSPRPATQSPAAPSPAAPSLATSSLAASSLAASSRATPSLVTPSLVTPSPATPDLAVGGSLPPPLPAGHKPEPGEAPDDAVLAAAAAASRPRRAERVTLQPADDVERAPAIGPRMAGHLAGIGIKTVAELLAANPADIASRLALGTVTDDTVRRWQEQARLVSTIPGLRGTHTFLFIGAGYGSLEAIAAAPADRFCADVLAYAATAEGQKLLRDMPAPDMERIKAWAEAARDRAAA